MAGLLLAKSSPTMDGCFAQPGYDFAKADNHRMILGAVYAREKFSSERERTWRIGAITRQRAGCRHSRSF